MTQRGWAIAMVTILMIVLGAHPAPAGKDSDHDGMPDRWERQHDLHPFKKDGRLDPDHDTVRNKAEFNFRTDPHVQDTDGDGSDDGDEVATFYTDPNDQDSDGDGVFDGDDDADGDGTGDEDHDDALEVCKGFDDRDTDRDGLDDEDENDRATSPGSPDSDGDGVLDGHEDSNSDGLSDEDDEDSTRDYCYRDQDEDLNDISAPGAMGRATAGPYCPAQKENDPSCNDRPVEDVDIVVEDANGKQVARVTTGADGWFAFQLDPGDYVLVPEGDDRFMGSPGPTDFIVEQGRITELPREAASYDTGIR